MEQILLNFFRSKFDQYAKNISLSKYQIHLRNLEFFRRFLKNHFLMKRNIDLDWFQEDFINPTPKFLNLDHREKISEHIKEANTYLHPIASAKICISPLPIRSRSISYNILSFLRSLCNFTFIIIDCIIKMVKYIILIIP